MSKIAIIFVLTYLGGILGAILIDGAYGVFLYEIEYFVNPKSQWWCGNLPNLRYSFIIAISILVGFLIRTKQYSHNRIFDVPQAKWILAFTILMGLISFIAVWPEKHMEIYINYLKVIVFVFLMYKMIDTPQKYERMIWAFLIGSFYCGWIVHSMGRGFDGRVEGIGPSDSREVNALASLLIAPIPILVFYVIEGKKHWQKIVSVLFLAYIMDGVILCNSRGAFLGLVAGVLYFLYFIFFKKIKSFNFKIKMAIGLVFAMGLFYYLTDTSFWERIGTLHDIKMGEEGYVGGGSERTYFWKKGLELAKEHPLGVGGWGYLYLSPRFIPLELRKKETSMKAPHSTWISVLVDNGYIGFIIFMGIILSSFRLSMKVRKHLIESKSYYLYYQNVAISAGYIAFLVASCFIDRVYAEAMYWFPTFAACFANIYLLKEYSNDGVTTNTVI